MKKVFALIATVVFIVAMMSSCKSTADCPAYSQVEVESNSNNA